MSDSLEASYTACRRLTRQTAGNFGYAFLVLPREQRRAMDALYAFLRRTDDLGDSDLPRAERQRALAAWGDSLRDALEGRYADPLLPALHDTVRRYAIPVEHLWAVVEGVTRDLDPPRFTTFDELAEYCHLVASAVGLACIHVWGFRSPAAVEPARQCGLAFQLTNILRDLKEDAARGRIYLPSEDLERFGYTPDDLRAGRRNDAFRALMRFEIERAEACYRRAEALDGLLMPDGRKVYGAMRGIYRALLDEIRRRDGDVFSRRVALSPWRKLAIAAWHLGLPRGPVPTATAEPGAGR